MKPNISREAGEASEPGKKLAPDRMLLVAAATSRATGRSRNDEPTVPALRRPEPANPSVTAAVFRLLPHNVSEAVYKNVDEGIRALGGSRT